MYSNTTWPTLIVCSFSKWTAANCIQFLPFIVFLLCSKFTFYCYDICFALLSTHTHLFLPSFPFLPLTDRMTQTTNEYARNKRFHLGGNGHKYDEQRRWRARRQLCCRCTNEILLFQTKHKNFGTNHHHDDYEYDGLMLRFLDTENAIIFENAINQSRNQKKKTTKCGNNRWRCWWCWT